jgi:hypothetical protein
MQMSSKIASTRLPLVAPNDARPIDAPKVTLAGRFSAS